MLSRDLLLLFCHTLTTNGFLTLVSTIRHHHDVRRNIGRVFRLENDVTKTNRNLNADHSEPLVVGPAALVQFKRDVLSSVLFQVFIAASKQFRRNVSLSVGMSTALNVFRRSSITCLLFSSCIFCIPARFVPGASSVVPTQNEASGRDCVCMLVISRVEKTQVTKTSPT